MKIFAYFQTFFHCLFAFAHEHLWMHCFHLDFVQDCTTIDDTLEAVRENECSVLTKLYTKLKRNIHYLIGLVGLMAIVLDTFLVITRAGFPQYSSSPELFTHKILVQFFWSQADIIFTVVIIMTMLVYVQLMIGPSLGYRWKMFALHQGGSVQIIVNGKGMIRCVCSLRIFNFSLSIQHGIKDKPPSCCNTGRKAKDSTNLLCSVYTEYVCFTGVQVSSSIGPIHFEMWSFCYICHFLGCMYRLVCDAYI